jgi:peptidylprolyl isomerase
MAFGATVLLAVACSRSAAAADAVARIGGTDVSTEELRSYIASLDPQEQAALAKDPALLTQTVRAYLTRQAVLREAGAKKWDQQLTVKAQLERVREQALVELYLQTVSRPADGYPTDAQVQAAYDANKSLFQIPRQFRVAQIFAAAAQGADQESQEKARKRIEEAAKKVKQKPAEFADVARGASDEKDAAQRGGEIGWLTEAQIVPGIRATVTGLAKEAISEPVRLDDGWHLIKLLDTRPASVRPLAEVREKLVAQLRAEQAKANRQAYLAKLLEQNPPAINELALARLLAKAR